MEQQYYIIFGASGAAIKTADILLSLQIPFEFFIDNDSSKWNSLLKGKAVKEPDILTVLPENYYLMIASDYYEEIEQQVLSLGFPLERIIQKESFLLEAVSRLISISDFPSFSFSQSPTFIIDLAEGFGIGGIETWSYIAAKELAKQNQVTIYTKEDTMFPSDLLPLIETFPFSFEKFSDGIQSVIKKMKHCLPCIVFANWYFETFYTALLLKQKYPKQVTLIGMVHHDMLRYYRRNQIISNQIDSFLCVSTAVKKRMVDEFYIAKSKVHYAPVPIIYEMDYVKEPFLSNAPIRIGFGARLVASKKRADLLIPFIEALESLSCYYSLWIAGEGKYQEQIQAYVTEHQLDNKIKLLGAVPSQKMKDLWKHVHIVLSVSDSEGIGLSILEGMSYGAVPVVTKTAGIEEFIQDGVNGYVCPLYDMKYIAEKITYLSQHPEAWYKFSKLSRNIIKDKCQPDRYISFLMHSFRNSYEN